jgi:uncharacterized GH25 family protein
LIGVHFIRCNAASAVVARSAALVLLCAAGPASAHEFWLQPDTFVAAPGDVVNLQFRVGAGWPGEARALDADRALRSGWIDATGEHTMGGSVNLRASKVGPAWAVFRSNRAALTLEAAAFESYLRDEGLEHILDARRIRGESVRPGREIYSRCAETLLQIGAGSTASALVPRPMGLTLELVPQNARRLLAGDTQMAVKLLNQGKPLRAALVRALPQTGGTSLSARTDSRGVAVLPLAGGGVWLLNAVHMVRANARIDADWESIWSSLTLQLPVGSDGAAADSNHAQPAPRPL